MYPFIIYLNMDENIFKYGSYNVDKETLLRSLQYEDNLKGYSQYRRYSPEQDSEFRQVVEYLYNGINEGSITGTGFGKFTDNSQNIYEDNQIYRDALNYVHKIANQIGNSTPKEKTKNNDTNESIVFDTSKHGFHNYFLNSLDRFGTTSDYTQLVKDYTNSFGGDLSKAIADFNQKITDYQKKHNKFTGMDISAHNYATPEEYNADLEKLKLQLSDGSIDPQDRILANSLGIGPVLTAVFGKSDSQSFQNPTASNAFNPQKHGFRSYFAKSIASPFSSGNNYTSDLSDYINQFAGDKQKLGDDVISKIYDYQKANNSFAEYDFSAYGIKPEDYNKKLEELKIALMDSDFSSSDYYLAKQVGMHDILSEIFGNPTGGFKSGTQTTKVNQEEVKKDLLEQNWTINEHNQWVMPNGLVTGFSSNENPIAAIEQMTWGEYISDEDHLADPDSDTWWTSTLTPSDKKRMWAIISDVASLIDPEPFTAAGLGYASDYLTHQADKLDGNVNWGRTALNVGLSTLGAVPILGDVALGVRIGKNIGKTAKVLTGLLAIPAVVAMIDQAPEIGESWNKMLTNIKSMTVEDWRNVYNVFSLVLGGVNTTRSYAGYRAAKRASQSADDVLQLQVKRNGQTEDVIIQDKQGIDDLLKLKDKPDEFKKYLKDNYEGFDNFELAKVTKQNVKVDDPEAGWFRKAIRQNKKKVETEIVSTTTGKGAPDLKTNLWTNRARFYLDDVVLGNKIKRKTNNSTEPTTRQGGEAGTTRTGEGDTPTPITENSQADIIQSNPKSSDTPEPTTSGNTSVAENIKPDIQPDIESNLSKSLRDKDITNKPVKPSLNSRSFDGIIQIIHKTNLPDESKSLIRTNLYDLQNKVKSKPDFNRAKRVYKGKQAKSEQYKKALSDLMDLGFSQKEVKKLLLDLGAYKQGGVLKAFTGLKLPNGVNLLNDDYYAGWDNYFNLDNQGNYILKDDLTDEQIKQRDTWLNSVNLAYTPETINYGQEYNPQFESYGSVYKPYTKSSGLADKDSSLRSDKLKIGSVSGNEEIDLNTHVAPMYQDDAVGNRIKDLLNYYTTNQNQYKTIDDFLKDYNSTIDSFYQFKQGDLGNVYNPEGNEETKAFNEKYNSVYGLHNQNIGYDPEQAHINGSATMARGIDITDDHVFLDVSGNEELSKLLGDKKLYKAPDGRIYVKKDASLMSTRKTNEGKERTMSGDNTFDRTGDIMPTKTESINFSPIFSAANYYNALRTNKELYDMSKENHPLLYDPKEDHRMIYGDLRAKVEGQKKAAELNNLASKPITSDGNLATATQLEAFIQGQKYINEGNAADDKALKENMEKAWEQELENHENRYNVAMKNRENMFQVNKENLLAKANYKRANYESTTKFIDEMKRLYNSKREENEAFKDSYYKAALQQHMQRNPESFVDGWNEADTELWEKGQSGQELTNDEQIRYSKLRQLVTQGYYSLLSQEYGTNIAKPNANWIESVFNVTIPEKTSSQKKGGKINRDKAKVIIDYLKESNNNYNKAIDRSIRGLYNHIKLQRK